MSGVARVAPSVRDVRGPSALGGDWQRFGRLLVRMSRTEFKLRFHDSALGYAWPLLNPLLLFLVLYVALTQIIRLGGSIEHYGALLLFNIMLYTFFSEATGRAVTSLVNRESVVRKVRFPRAIVPLSTVLTAVMTLGFSLVAAVGFMLATGVQVQLTWLLAPFPIIALIAFSAGCAMLLSALYVRFRDASQIWTVLTRAGFYASPVLFTVELYPDRWKALLFLNPLAPLLAQTRVWLFDPDAPSYTEAMGGPLYLLGPLVIGLTVCVGGAWYFFRQAPRVAEKL